MTMSFEIDGVPLRRSIFSMGSYRAAPCERLLDVRPETLELALDLLAEHGTHNNVFSGVRIAGLNDLEFLRDYPSLLYLDAEDISAKALQCIESICNLRGLRLDAPKGGVDLSCFPELEQFIGDWHRDNTGIGSCGELRNLRASGFRSTRPGLSSISDCVRIERLHLVRPGITSLDDVAALEDLRYLDIAYAPKIKDLTPLAASPVDLRELALTNLKNISDYSPLASIRRLRRLIISNCGPMEDLAWTKGMDYLDLFSFVGTKVLNCDLSPLLSLPRLRYASAGNRRVYSHSDNELNALIDQAEE
jgi:hypothetical protein